MLGWPGEGEGLLRCSCSLRNSSLRCSLASALLPLLSFPFPPLQTTNASGLDQLLSILEKTMDDQHESHPGSSSLGCPGSPSTNLSAAGRVHMFCKA